MAVGTSITQLASLVIAVLTGRRITRVLRSAETSLRDIGAIARRCLWSAALRLASAILLALLTGGVAGSTFSVSNCTILVLKWVNDLAYALGLSWGVVLECNIGRAQATGL